MNILFICKHNRFRSKVAEAIFKTLTKKHKAKSAGIVYYFPNPFVAKNVIKIMKEKGYDFENEMSKKVDEMDVRWADKIVIVANNVDEDIFKEKNVEKWGVSDADENDVEKVSEIIDEIEEKVRRFVEELNT